MPSQIRSLLKDWLVTKEPSPAIEEDIQDFEAEKAAFLKTLAALEVPEGHQLLGEEATNYLVELWKDHYDEPVCLKLAAYLLEHDLGRASRDKVHRTFFNNHNYFTEDPKQWVQMAEVAERSFNSD